MTETRCALTELLIDQCAHCLGQLGEPTADLVVHRTVTAIHRSRCAIDGRHPIEPGDRIGWTDHGWLCTGCTEGGA